MKEGPPKPDNKTLERIVSPEEADQLSPLDRPFDYIQIQEREAENPAHWRTLLFRGKLDIEGNIRLVNETKASSWSKVLPDGQRILYFRKTSDSEKNEFVVMDLLSGQTKILDVESSVKTEQLDRLFYLSNGELGRVFSKGLEEGSYLELSIDVVTVNGTKRQLGTIESFWISPASTYEIFLKIVATTSGGRNEVIVDRMGEFCVDIRTETYRTRRDSYIYNLWLKRLWQMTPHSFSAICRPGHGGISVTIDENQEPAIYLIHPKEKDPIVPQFYGNDTLFFYRKEELVTGQLVNWTSQRPNNLELISNSWHETNSSINFLDETVGLITYLYELTHQLQISARNKNQLSKIVKGAQNTLSRNEKAIQKNLNSTALDYGETIVANLRSKLDILSAYRIAMAEWLNIIETAPRSVAESSVATQDLPKAVTRTPETDTLPRLVEEQDKRD